MTNYEQWLIDLAKKAGEKVEEIIIKINYKHKKYALLENGDVQPLYYENGEQRMICYDENKKCYSLSYDIFYKVDNDTYGNAFCNSKILR